MISSPGSVTFEFAQLLSCWDASSCELTDAARLLLMDGVAVAAAGATEPSAGIAAGLARDEGANAHASVIGHGFSTSLAWAARINGISMHALDFEPMWFPPNHALSCVLPAIMALAEWRERQTERPHGRALLEGLAKGVEAQGRLRLSSGELEPRQVSLHPPAAVGAIASAVAAAHLLELDSRAMAAAIGIASSRLGGTLANVGSMTKALHCGDAAAHGLEAALLASRGFTSDADALAGPRGWGPVLFGQGFNVGPLLEPVRVPRILDPGPAFKLYPSQYATHFAITAALEARTVIQDATCISRVEMRVPDMPYIDRPHPESGLAGKFSWQYTVAAALLDSRIDRASFSDQRRHSPDMESMLGRIHVISDPAIPCDFARMHVDITVHTANGQVVRCRCERPPGRLRGGEALSQMVENKARGLLREALGTHALGCIMELFEQIPQRFAVLELMRHLCLGRDWCDIEVPDRPLRDYLA